MASSARSDPLSQLDAPGNIRAEIGRSASNRPAFAPYRPSVLSEASDLAALADSPEIQPEVITPVPDGMEFASNSATTKLQLQLNPMYARRFRRVFGYVCEIQLSDVTKGAAPWVAYLFPLLLLFGLLPLISLRVSLFQS